MATCDKCKSTIRRNKGNWMACDGFCSKMFHTECISLTESDLMTCIARNIMWFCDECLPKLWEIKNRETVNSTKSIDVISRDTITSLEAQIEKLNADIANMNETLQDVISCSNTREGKSDARRTFCEPNSMQQSNLLCGTKDSTPSFSNCSTSSPSCSTSHCFWMYFTRIASFTSENDIRNLVRESLHCDGRIFVRKLVPPWKDPATMDYVSFKVGIAENFKDMAMETSTWPKGLRFREFVNAENSLWAPPLSLN